MSQRVQPFRHECTESVKQPGEMVVKAAGSIGGMDALTDLRLNALLSKHNGALTLPLQDQISMISRRLLLAVHSAVRDWILVNPTRR